MATSGPLPEPFQTLAPALDHYGYLAVGGVLFLENLGIPFPGETILIAAALYAGTGRLDIVAVGIIAMASSVAGSACGYWIGATGGRALLERYGRRVGLTAERLDRLEGFVNRRGFWLIVVGRYVDGLRQLSGLVAGFSEMTWRRFLIATTIGAALWVATFTLLGDLAGNHVATVSKYFAYFAALAAAGVVVTVIRHLIRRRRRPAASDAGS
jgi:membrane protein DedA with SNARE-associated domain